MADFYPTNAGPNTLGFVRGAARLMVAPMETAFPTKISDTVELGTPAVTGPPAVPAVLGTFAAKTGWINLGGTKTGVAVVHNNAEENFDIDQIMGDIGSSPTNWEMFVQTALAEVTPENLELAWEASTVTTDATPVTDAGSAPEKEVGFGQPTAYTQRRLAILHRRPSGLIRAHFFRIVQRTPQESTFTYSKTGEQQTIPTRFRCLADSTVADVKKRFGIMRDQQSGGAVGA